MVGGLFPCWSYYVAVPVHTGLVGRVVTEPVLMGFAWSKHDANSDVTVCAPVERLYRWMKQANNA